MKIWKAKDFLKINHLILFFNINQNSFSQEKVYINGSVNFSNQIRYLIINENKLCGKK
jgi:hypothetical protein